MARFLVLAQSEVTARAIDSWLELLAISATYGAGAVSERIVFDPSEVSPGEELTAIRSLARRLEVALGLGEQGRLGARTVVLVDAIDPGRMNPLAEGGGWDGVIAQLLLAFPEIHWVFGVVRGPVGAAFPEAEHSLAALAALPAAQPLFDGSGLRDWVRGRVRAALSGEELGDHLPSRPKLALAIDDEPSYAYFSAYVAYRFGYRARVVGTEAELVRLLGEKGSAGEDLALAFEDLFLNFPDRRKDRGTGGRAVHWSDLEERTEQLPKLTELRPLRVFVTTGHRKGSAHERRRRNREISRALGREGRLGTVVRKPLAGVFDLWDRSGLRKALARKGNPRGHAEGFEWPPADSGGSEAGGGSHSAPGRLLEISGWLLERAERLLAAEVRSVPEAVHGAVLATEALELLGGKTPTTALDALSLRHAFEVTAECQFHGVVAHFDVRARAEDLRNEIEALSVYFARETRKMSCWSAEAAILGRLIKIFREHEQFDEELQLQIRNRRLHRRMWFKSQRWWGPLGDQLRWLNPAYWAVRYVHFLVDSVPRFLVCITLWVLLLAVLRGANMALGAQQPYAPSFVADLADSLSAFLGVNAPAPDPGGIPSHPLYLATVAIATVGGVLHFGILVSHLYSLVSRR